MKIQENGVLSIFRHFLNYFSSSIVINALGLVAIPIFTRAMSLEEYGYTSLFRSYCSAFMLVFSINMQVSIVRYFYEGREEFAKFFGTIFFLLCISFTVVAGSLLIFRENLALWLNLPENLLLGIPVVGAAALLAIIWEQLLQAKRQSAQIAKVRVIQSLSTFLCSVSLLLLVASEKYMAVVYAQVAIGLIAGGYFLKNLLPMLEFDFSSDHIRYMAAFSLPMLLYVFGADILSYFDRLLINSQFGARDAGIYALASNISALVSVAWVSLQSAWIPLFYERMNTGEYSVVRAHIERILRCFIFFAGTVILFSKEIGLILAPAKFQNSFGLIPIIMIANVIMLASNIYTMVINFRKKTGYLSLVFIVSSAVSILLNITLIPRFGYSVGAYTSLAAAATTLILAWFFCAADKNEYTPSLQLVIKPLWIIGVSVFAYYLFSYLAVPEIFAFAGKLMVVLLLGYLNRHFLKEVIGQHFKKREQGG